MFFGIVAVVTSFIGLIPQVYKSFRTKNTEGLSMAMLINYAICSLAWVAHSMTTEDGFVWLSNVAGLASSILLILLKWRYDQKNSPKNGTKDKGSVSPEKG